MEAVAVSGGGRIGWFCWTHELFVAEDSIKTTTPKHVGFTKADMREAVRRACARTLHRRWENLHPHQQNTIDTSFERWLDVEMNDE
jgi:hypothetical protein